MIRNPLSFSENICTISLLHVNYLSADNRYKPFIFTYNNDIIGLVGRKITKIHRYFGDKLMHAALSLVVDATFIVQGWKILRPNNKIIGGASPNYCLDIGEKPKEELLNY